jgi:hypothetical protein
MSVFGPDYYILLNSNILNVDLNSKQETQNGVFFFFFFSPFSFSSKKFLQNFLISKKFLQNFELCLITNKES